VKVSIEGAGLKHEIARRGKVAKPLQVSARRAAVAGSPRRTSVDSSLRLHGTIAQKIGQAIVTGRLRPGHVLDGEIEASMQLHVSRSAYREATRILGAKGLLHSKPRTGTRVSEMSEWHLLDPDVLSWMFRGEPRPEVIHGLFELRKMVEPAAAALAAVRRTDLQLAQMSEALDRMATYTLRKPDGREADKAFHAALLAATANPFVISMIDGVSAAVDSLTEFKLRVSGLERDPVPDHRRVYEAIEAREAQRAQKAMARLIRLAILDMPVKHWPRLWR
jgi:DNA-binding FadR family transcriptional regulator